MILLKNYFINTTGDVDVESVIHEVNRTIREANAIDEPGHPGSGGFPGEGVLTKNRRKEEIDVGPRIAAAMLGKSLHIPLRGGKLVLGAREEPVLIDLEKTGRRREFCVQVIAEGGGAGQQKPAGRPQPRPRK